MLPLPLPLLLVWDLHINAGCCQAGAIRGAVAPPTTAAADTAAAAVEQAGSRRSKVCTARIRPSIVLCQAAG